MKRMYWRKQKTLAMLANRRQWNMEFLPSYSSEVEIELESGEFLITEASTTASPQYIRTE